MLLSPVIYPSGQQLHLPMHYLATPSPTALDNTENVRSKQIRAQRNRHGYVIPLPDLSMHCNNCSRLVAVSDSWETKPTHVCHVNQRTINRLCNISTPQRTCETGMTGRAHSLVHSNAGFITVPPPEDHQSCWADQSSPSAKIFVEQPFFKAL